MHSGVLGKEEVGLFRSHVTGGREGGGRERGRVEEEREGRGVREDFRKRGWTSTINQKERKKVELKDIR